MHTGRRSSFLGILGRVIGIAGSVWVGTLTFQVAAHASNLGAVHWGRTLALLASGVLLGLGGFWLETRASSG